MSMQNSIDFTASPARVLLFMTHERPADVPGDEQPLACLLPLGTASFAERTMDSCALAGVRQLDVVVSDSPEACAPSCRTAHPGVYKLTGTMPRNLPRPIRCCVPWRCSQTSAW